MQVRPSGYRFFTLELHLSLFDSHPKTKKGAQAPYVF